MAIKNTENNLKPEIIDLSVKITGGLVADHGNGTIIEKEGADIYNSNLPEGLTPEIIRNVSDYNTTFIAAGAHAVGLMSVDMMANNSSLDRVTGEIAMGYKDSVGFTIDRRKEYTNSLGDGEPQTVEKYGVLRHSYDVRAGKNGSQLKSVREFIGQLSATKLRQDSEI